MHLGCRPMNVARTPPTPLPAPTAQVLQYQQEPGRRDGSSFLTFFALRIDEYRMMDQDFVCTLRSHIRSSSWLKKRIVERPPSHAISMSTMTSQHCIITALHHRNALAVSIGLIVAFCLNIQNPQKIGVTARTITNVIANDAPQYAQRTL